MSDITTKAKRAKLAPRRNPYFLKLGKGCHLGFRRGPETWIARYRDRSNKMHFNSLGALTASGGDEFEEARRLADAWFAQMSGHAHKALRRGTVADALQAYVMDLRDERNRPAAAINAERMFARVIVGDPIADILLVELTSDDFKQWRKRIAISGARKRRHDAFGTGVREEALRRAAAGEKKRSICESLGMDRRTLYDWQCGAIKEPQRTERQPQSINRIVRSVKAGLNASLNLGFVGNSEAWTSVPRLSEDEQESAARFLNCEQRSALISHADQLLQAYLRGLEACGARPGELAAAVVGDFDFRNGSVKFRSRKGKGAQVRVRTTTLSSSAVAFFRQHARSKLPAAPLFMGPDGGCWKPHQWSTGIRAAVATANSGKSARDDSYIPDGACAYSFRHSYISELLQVAKLDPITVCKMTGTSQAMMQKTYWHLIHAATREALDTMQRTA